MKTKENTSNTIKVETEIKFQVTDKMGKSVDAYNTGDYFSKREFHVKRKQMKCDIPVMNGGSKVTEWGFSDELIMIHNEEGVDTFATFDNINLAQIFCKALNEMPQAELLTLVNEDEYKSSVSFN